MNDWWDMFFEYVAPVMVVILCIVLVIVMVFGAMAIFEEPSPMNVDTSYSFNTKVVDNHNILVISRNNSTQFEALDLGPVEAEKKDAVH